MTHSRLLSLMGLRAAAGHDIELPNESGRRDPRLPKQPSSIRESLHDAAEGYRALQGLSKSQKPKK